MTRSPPRESGDNYVDTHRPLSGTPSSPNTWRCSVTDNDAASLSVTDKLNGHDPCRYLTDVLERLPTQPASQLDELLPHHWQRRS